MEKEQSTYFDSSDEDRTEKKEILAAIKQVQTDLSAMQNEMKTRQKMKTNTAKPFRKCENCKSADECKHCFHCGGLNHIVENDKTLCNFRTLICYGALFMRQIYFPVRYIFNF